MPPATTPPPAASVEKPVAQAPTETKPLRRPVREEYDSPVDVPAELMVMIPVINMGGTHFGPDYEKVDKNGNPLTRQYVRGDKFRVPKWLAMKWPEKLQPQDSSMSGMTQTLNEFMKKPGESDKDYAARVNKLAEQLKSQTEAGFNQAHGGSTNTIDAMTLDELKKYCTEEGIDISGCKTKDDLIRTIKSFEE